MKKNILLALIFIFSLLLDGEKTFASSASVALIGNNVVTVGDEFDVTLEADSEEPLSEIETYISYDDKVGEFLSADDGIAGGKGLLRVNIRSFEDIKGKLKYKMKFLARKAGNFNISFSDEVHLYAADTDDEISVSSSDLEILVKNKREASSDSSLSNLKVAGAKLEPQFSKSVLDYTAEVGPDADELVIGVDPSDANSEYSLRKDYGDKLQTGENKIKIIVTAEDKSTTTYTITVNKAGETEDKPEPAEDKNVSKGAVDKENNKPETASKSSIIEEPEYVPDPPSEKSDTETDIKDSKQTVIYVIIGAAAILGFMLILGAVFYAKNKRNDEDED